MRSKHDVPGPHPSVPRRALLSTVGLVAAAALVGCSGQEVSGFELLSRARELATSMHVALNQAADASNRAVMAESEAAAQEAATAAAKSRGEVRAHGSSLAELLSGPGFSDERAQLELFDESFSKYEALDAEIGRAHV